MHKALGSIPSTTHTQNTLYKEFSSLSSFSMGMLPQEDDWVKEHG
jgi:hypothetical protein